MPVSGSAEPVHARLIRELETAVALRFVGTDGGVVSETGLFTLTVTGAEVPAVDVTVYWNVSGPL